MTEPAGPSAPYDRSTVLTMLRAAFDIWEQYYQQRYKALLPHVAALGIAISSENDYVTALTVTPPKIFKIQFDELETFVFVHALNALDHPSEYPKVV